MQYAVFSRTTEEELLFERVGDAVAVAIGFRVGGRRRLEMRGDEVRELEPAAGAEIFGVAIDLASGERRFALAGSAGRARARVHGVVARRVRGGAAQATTRATNGRIQRIVDDFQHEPR